MPFGSVTRMAVWIGLLVAGVFFLSAGGSYGGIEYVPARIASQVLAYAILGSWLLIALLRPAWRPTTPLVLPVLLVMGAYTLAALLSQRPRLSFEPFTAGLGWAIAFLFLGRVFADPWLRSRIRVVLTILPVLVAVAYIVEVVARWIEWWSLVGGFAIPPLRPGWAGLIYGSPNIVGTILLLTAPLGAVLLAQRTNRWWPSGLVLGLVAVAIFLTGSRGAWLGAATAGVLGLAFLVTSYRGRLDGLSSGVARMPRSVAITGLLIGATGLALLIPAVLQRLLAGGTTLRLDLWRSALSIFTEHPVTGGGPGTWVQLKVEANPPGVPNLILEHAHNLYVQAAAELGIVGLVALMILTIAVAWRLVVAMRRGALHGDYGVSGAEAVAVAVALVGFAAQSLVDNLVNLPVVCLVLIVVVAWVDGGLEADSLRTPRSSRSSVLSRISRSAALPIVGLLAMLLLVPTMLRIDQAALSAMAGDAAVLRGDDEAALAAYEASVRADESFTLYRLQRASTLARMGRVAEALEEYRAVAPLDPLGVNIISLAALELEAGNGEAALADAHRAISLAPTDPVVLLNAGVIAENRGDFAFARDSYVGLLTRYPSVAGSDFWDDPARRIPKSELFAAARAESGALNGSLILAYGGKPSAAREELRKQPPSSRRDVYLAAVDWLDGQSDKAMDALSTIARSDPLDWVAAAWASRVSRLSGNREADSKFSSWATTVMADSAPSEIREASIQDGPDRDPWAGLPGYYPTPVYLRRIPPFLVPPQVVLVARR